MPQMQWEQHQAVKSSPSTQIKGLLVSRSKGNGSIAQIPKCVRNHEKKFTRLLTKSTPLEMCFKSGASEYMVDHFIYTQAFS